MTQSPRDRRISRRPEPAYADGSLFDATTEAARGDSHESAALSDPEAAVLQFLRSMGPADEWQVRHRAARRR